MTGIGETFSARSWLFAPGDSEKKMGKAAAGAADVVIFDLEDAVAEEEKPRAREMVSAFLEARPPQDRARLWVRVNPLDGPHTLADLAAVVPARTWSASTTTSRRWRSPPASTRARRRSSCW
jgi:citrate lyase subunit beta/citryl-CoA lyase